MAFAYDLRLDCIIYHYDDALAIDVFLMSQFIGRTFRSYKAQRAQRSQPRGSEPRVRTREGEAMEAQLQQFQARKMMARKVSALQGQMPVEPNERKQLLLSLHKRVADVEKRMKQLKGSSGDSSSSCLSQSGLVSAVPQLTRSEEAVTTAHDGQSGNGWALAGHVVYVPHVKYDNWEDYSRCGSYKDRVLEQHMLADDNRLTSPATPLPEQCCERHHTSGTSLQLASKVSELFEAFESSSFGTCSQTPPCAIPVTTLESDVLSSSEGRTPKQVAVKSEESLQRDDSDRKKRKRTRRRRKKPNNY